MGTSSGLKLAGWGLWFYQVSGLRWLARQTGLVARIGGVGLAGWEGALPRAASPLRRARARRQRVTRVAGARRLKVGFFLGCLSEIAFFETNQHAIEVLAAAGCEVTVVPGQGCCGAVLKEYGHHFRTDPQWAERAATYSARCRDFAELVGELAPLPFGPLSGRITYQDSCHLRNVQKVVSQPRQLLRSIPGVEYVELPEADHCCSAAGTYAMTHARMADDLLDQKMAHVRQTRATTVVVANPPCALEMMEGVQRAGLAGQVQVMHIADVLAEAVRAGRKRE
ncbi:MAG: (Fe-S)-binding protein [Mycobacterium leprae]